MQGAHVRSWARESWGAMRDALHDGMAEDVARSHGVSFAAAAVTLIVSLLLVHRQDHSSTLRSPVPNCMVGAHAHEGHSLSVLAIATTD